MAIDADPDVSPFLRGNFAPVHDELDVRGLPVTGELPAGLRGLFVRNGGNPLFPPLGAYHLFDGDGMLHAVELDGEGGAAYRNRWVRGKGFLAEERAGRALFGGLSNWTMPSAELLEEVGIYKDTSNTHVIRHHGRILALMEGQPPREVGRDLSTMELETFGGAVTGSFTAHPKLDPTTGELLFFGYSPFPPYVMFGVVSPDGELVRYEGIDLPRGVMMHDFVVTDRRVVFFDLPAVFDPMAVAVGGDFLSWQPEHGARIGVLDRDAAPGTASASVRWFELDPFFVFHFLNGHDDGDAVVVDGCRAPGLGIGFGSTGADEPMAAADVSASVLHRWRLDLATGAVTDGAIDDRACDFPRVAAAAAGLDARYGYAGGYDPAAADLRMSSVIKYDHGDGDSAVVHDWGAGVEAGEPVFCADPDGTAEDDGWIATYVHDRATAVSDWVLLDAHDLTEVARVHLPRRVPFGFHASWMPE